MSLAMRTRWLVRLTMTPRRLRPSSRRSLGIDLGDGLVFDVRVIATAVMREGDDYQGLRVRVPGDSHPRDRLHSSTSTSATRLRVHRCARRSFVDGVEQATSFMLNAYRIEDVLAEKIATMVDRGDLNTRERDFSDVG